MTTAHSSHHVSRWLEELLPGAQASRQINASLETNPGRIDGAYADLLSGYFSDPAEILARGGERADESARRCRIESLDIPFVSFCAHHFLPFFGTVDVAYTPGTHILGLGKIGRLVACRARRLQLQEYLVQEIAEDVMHHGGARGAKVTASARHVCICYRGPSTHGVVNRTVYVLGDVAEQ